MLPPVTAHEICSWSLSVDKSWYENCELRTLFCISVPCSTLGSYGLVPTSKTYNVTPSAHVSSLVLSANAVRGALFRLLLTFSPALVPKAGGGVTEAVIDGEVPVVVVVVVVVWLAVVGVTLAFEFTAPAELPSDSSPGSGGSCTIALDLPTRGL